MEILVKPITWQPLVPEDPYTLVVAFTSDHISELIAMRDRLGEFGNVTIEQVARDDV